MNAIETVKTLITALQSGDMEEAANVMSDSFTITGLGMRPLNKQEWLVTQSQLLAAMPDFSYNLDDAHETSENTVEALIRITGTQQNELHAPLLIPQPIPATGLAVDLPQVPTRYHVAQGQVTQMSLENVPGGGVFGLIQQIGDEIPLLPRERNIAD